MKYANHPYENYQYYFQNFYTNYLICDSQFFNFAIDNYEIENFWKIII